MFVIGYYGLWAAADAIILTTGADMGFLLRVLPNALYYGGFVPVVAWTAPQQAHRARLLKLGEAGRLRISADL